MSDHAVARYQERVRPGLSLPEAEAELMRVLPFGEVTLVKPSFVFVAEPDTVGWLVVGDGIAFPLAQAGSHLVAVTCLTRAGASDEVLAVRRRRKQLRRNARRHNADTRRGTSRRRFDEAAA